MKIIGVCVLLQVSVDVGVCVWHAMGAYGCVCATFVRLRLM